MPSTPLSYFPALFGLSFLWTGALVAQERAQAETEGNTNSIIRAWKEASTRELSPLGQQENAMHITEKLNVPWHRVQMPIKNKLI